MRTAESPTPTGIAPSLEGGTDLSAKIEAVRTGTATIRLFSATKQGGKFAEGDSSDLESVIKAIKSTGALQVGNPVIDSDYGCRDGCKKELTVLRSPNGIDFRTETIVPCRGEESVAIWVTKSPPPPSLLSKIVSKIF